MRWSLILSTLCMLISGCQKQNPSSHSEQVLHLNLAADPVSLDPRLVRSLKDLTLVKQLFEGLMRLDAQGVPQPAIASSVDISPDLLTYTFHLRDAFWSNGEPITASDFIAAWQEVLNPAFASDYSYMLYPIKHAQEIRSGACAAAQLAASAPDEKTLVVELLRPTPYFLELTAFPTFFPVSQATAARDPNWSSRCGASFVCNGPFHLQEWQPECEMILDKNPTYWDSGAVQLAQINFSVITDNNTESQLFEKRELDWLGQPVSHSIAAELLAKMKGEGKLDSYGVAGTFWLKFNTAQKPFDNLKIRKAFSLAIKRGEIITHILQGNQSVATGLLPPCMALASAPYFTDGDTQTALSLFQEGLAETGWTPQTFPKVILSYGVPNARTAKIMQLVQQQWQTAFGIQVELQALDRPLFVRNAKRGLYQVGAGDWFADFNDPLAFLEPFKFKIDSETVAGINDTGWQDPTYISLLEAATREPNPAERKQLLTQAEALLIEAMPIAPIYHYSFDYVKQPYVQDVVLSPLGIADFKTAHLTPR